MKPLYALTDMFGDAFEISLCTSCGARVLTPTPTAEQSARAYDDTYYGEQETKFNPLIEFVVDKFRYFRSRQLMGHLSSGSRVLDIGCGNGRFLSFLKRHSDVEIFGVEQPGNSAQRAARVPGLTLKVGALGWDDFAPASFDAITLFHVFEHLQNPKEVLEMVARFLKPGGVLVLSMPHIDSWQSRWFKGRWLHLDPPRHLFFFSPEQLSGVLETHGFRISKVRYVSIEQNPFGMVQSSLNLWMTKREVLFERLKGNSHYGKEYSRLVILLNTLFFVVSFPLFVFGDIVSSAFRKGATFELTCFKR